MTTTITSPDSATTTAGRGLELLFTYRIGFQLPPEVVGPVPDGLRVIFPLTGGEFVGPHLSGTIRRIGDDWLTVRQDGIGHLHLRTMLETEDGAAIAYSFSGTIDLGEHGYDDLLNGRLAPDGTPFRSAVRLETAHPAYAWLNRLQCVGIGQVFPSRGEARCAVYALR
jgi:hypothetical protein